MGFINNTVINEYYNIIFARDRIWNALKIYYKIKQKRRG